MIRLVIGYCTTIVPWFPFLFWALYVQVPAALKVLVRWVFWLSKVMVFIVEGVKTVLTSPEIGGEYMKVTLSAT